SQVALPGRCLLPLQLRLHIGRQGCQIAASTHRRALFRRHALPPPTAARIAASAALAFTGSPLRCTSAGSAFGGSGSVTPWASSRHTASYALANFRRLVSAGSVRSLCPLQRSVAWSGAGCAPRPPPGLAGCG